MSGGALVWLTDDELECILDVLESDIMASDESLALVRKLEAIQEEVACRVGPQ